jgi:hypothetical protein
MILGGSFTNLVPMLCGEFQMVRVLRMPEDDAVKLLVICKLGKDLKPSPVVRLDPAPAGWQPVTSWALWAFSEPFQKRSLLQ